MGTHTGLTPRWVEVSSMGTYNGPTPNWVEDISMGTHTGPAPHLVEVTLWEHALDQHHTWLR